MSAKPPKCALNPLLGAGDLVLAGGFSLRFPTGSAAFIRRRHPSRLQNLNLPQLRDDLLGLETLPRLLKGRLSADTINGIFPNEASITRPIGAVLFEQNDEWQIQHRYMQVEAFSQIDAAQTDPILSIRTQAA